MQKAPLLPIAAKAFFLFTGLTAAAAVLLSGSTFPSQAQWGWWLAVLPVVVLCHFPVVVTRGSNAIEIGFESVVIIFLSFAAPEHALALWTAAGVLAQMKQPAPQWARTTPPWITFYNAAMSVLSGAATVFVVSRCVPHALEPGPWALLAVGSGAIAYFLVDYVLSALAIPLLGHGSFRESWRYDGLAITLACSGGVAALGYLGAVVVRADHWALPLLLVPVWTFIAASRGYLDASRERSRVAALFTVAARLHHAPTPEEVTAIVLDEGRRALRVEQLSLVADPDNHGLRSSVHTGTALNWLVPAPRRSGEHFTAQDQQTLNLLACLASDSLRRLALHAELETLASHDALTGLPNRASLHRALVAELASRSPSPTAMLFGDLDGFKNVNDRLGHEAGDQLLRVVAERIRACIRDDDVVSRLGGDEFAVLLPRTPRDVALVIAEQVLTAVRQPTVLAAGVADVGISIGIAVSSPGSSADELLSEADSAMYEAKALGKGRVRLCRAAQKARVPEPRLGQPTRD